MKKNLQLSFLRLFLLTTLVAFSYTSRAAKAISLPMTFTQPDGSKISVILRGDEFMHWYSTADGVLLSRKGDIFYIANVDNYGDITSTGILAHEAGSRSGEEQIAIVSQQTATFFNTATTKMTRSAMMRESLGGNVSPAYFPHTDSPKAVVILVQFSDLKFSLDNPKNKFNQIFNATEPSDLFGTDDYQNYTSVRQYFKKVSSGNYTPDFTVVGPVTLNNTLSFYGGTSDYPDNEKPVQLITDAIRAAKDSVDFSSSDYDNNNDGTMDMVFVVFAGYGQNTGGPAESIWAKSGAINTKVEGVTIGRFCITPEINKYKEFWERKDANGNYKHNGGVPAINGIGVVCHEFSHAMGLPDIYPTNSDAYVDNQEMEYWDLMDGGEYVKYGYRPTAYTSWEREVMGWVKIDTLKKDTTVENMNAALNGGKAYRIVNDADNSEYFMLENVQRNNLNGASPGHGLLVYHVKWPTSYVSLNNSINNKPGKPDMAVVPADGALLSLYIDANNDYYLSSLEGDAFPGTSNVTALDNTLNLPNFVWYKGTSKVNKALTNISEDTEAGTISFKYISDFATGIQSVETSNTTQNNGRIYTIDGRYVGKSTGILPNGLYIRDGKKFILNK